MNLNSLKVVNSGAVVEDGYYFVEFEDGKILQCCLVASFDNSHFLNEVDCTNSGFTSGPCAECNEWAVGADGDWLHIDQFLIDKATADGVLIVAFVKSQPSVRNFKPFKRNAE
ncbi:MAG: hypothetical protein ACRC1W_00225 [Shewanella sp.]